MFCLVLFSALKQLHPIALIIFFLQMILCSFCAQNYPSVISFILVIWVLHCPDTWIITSHVTEPASDLVQFLV